MLNGLLKSEWQSDSVEKRIQAIAKMDPMVDENQSALAELAMDDPEVTVRQAALGKLMRPELVFQISQAHTNTLTRNHAESAFAHLIGTKSELTEAQFRKLMAANLGMLDAVAKHCPHANLRLELIQAMSESQLAKLIAGVEYIDTRQFIAEQLSSEEYLRQARNSLKGKDKNAEKIIKSKLDALHLQQREVSANHEAAGNICEKMEFLASHEWRADFIGKYSVWSQRWQALEITPDKDLVARYEQASNKVAALVQTESIIEDTHLGQVKLAEEIERYCVGLSILSMHQLVSEKPNLIVKVSESLAAWTKLSHKALPDPDIAEKFLLAERSLQSVSDFCDGVGFAVDAGDLPADEPVQIVKMRNASLKALQWPGQYPALAAIAEASAALQELKTHRQETQQAAAAKLEKLHKRINRLLGITNRGDLPTAKRELAAVNKAANRYTGKDKASLDERLEKAAAAVTKMSDWKNFATEPKLIELCEAMEALVSSKSHPDKLSAEINKLQQRWKALGTCDTMDQHWPRFKAAADLAYLPCSAFFKQRRDTQRQNLRQREPLLTQMRELYENTDWDAPPDYKKLENELQRINQAWQNIKDVERSAGQKQWNKLTKIRSAIYEKLDVVYNGNIELKNELIEQTLALLETEVTEQSIGKLQLYQNRWKQVGITRRKQDQAAWRKFKKASDDVYEKIQGVRQAKRSEEDEQLKAYRNIIRDIQQLAKNATDLAGADADFDRLQADYKALPALPKNLPEKLSERIAGDLRRASENYTKARSRIMKASQAKAMDAVSRKAATCAELEQLGADGDPQAIEKLQAALVQIEIMDKDLNRRLDQRIAKALDLNREEANRTRQRLCIELEILLGVASPVEDAAQRMKIQLERMKKDGIGHAQTASHEVLEQFQSDWLCLPGAEPKIQKILDKRFDGLIKAKR